MIAVKNEALLSTKEAATRLGISERKLWELTNRAEVPSVRIGRRVLYDPQDLREYVGRIKS